MYRNNAEIQIGEDCVYFVFGKKESMMKINKSITNINFV